MSDKRIQPDAELAALAAAHAAGELTPDLAALLERRCADDPTVMQTYLAYLDLEAELAFARVAESAEPAAQSPRTIESSQSRIAIPIAIAAALLVACGVAVYLLAFNTPAASQPGPPNPGPAVATLIESTGGTLTTPTGFPTEGDEFPAGDYTLDAGRAQFVLTNRVAVDLRGETRLRMYNPGNVFLARGHAEFKVPAGAEGFTVHLPDQSKIVDLGTAFTVDTDDDGLSRFRVTEGSVAWYAAPDADSVLVSAGQSVRIEDGQLHDIAVLAVTTKQLDTPPAVSADDLAQTQFLTSESVGSDEVATRHGELFNGIIGNADGTSDNTGEVKIAPGDSVTVTFDTSTHMRGYDITGIDTIFGWNPAQGGRSNQGYSITLTYVDDSTATLVEPTHWEPNTPASYWTKVSMRRAGGGTLHSEDIALNTNDAKTGPSVLASGVKAVTFRLTHAANAVGPVVAREIDIFGEPTPTPNDPETDQAQPSPENGSTPF